MATEGCSDSPGGLAPLALAPGGSGQSPVQGLVGQASGRSALKLPRSMPIRQRRSAYSCPLFRGVLRCPA